MKRPVALDDLMKYRYLSAPAFSPDGRSIAFLVHQGNLEENAYRTDIWLAAQDGGSLRQLTASGKEKAFCWLPDGRILFSSGRGETKGSGTNLYVLDISGGESLPYCTLPRSASAFTALADGRFLALGVHEPPVDNPYEADMYLFDQIPFSTNGKGFTAQKRTGLFLCTPEGDEQLLSPEDMDVSNYTLSDDGASVLVWGPVFRDVKRRFNTLLEMGLDGAPAQTILPGKDFTCRWAGWLGGEVLVTGTDMKRKGVCEDMKFHILRDTGRRCITPDFDRGLRNTVMSDCRFGNASPDMGFRTDGERAFFVATDGFRSSLYTVTTDGRIERFTRTLSTVDDWTVGQGRAAVVGMQGLQLQELYLVDEEGERRLTHFNDWLSEECLLARPEHVVVQNGTDLPVDGWFMRPIGLQEGERAPTILNVHGGPKFAYGNVFFHEMQYWAAQGYAVLFCNPRGSDGRGSVFDDVRGKYGTVDYDDLMAFVDLAVSLPFVDKDRMGVTGGSYGGFMTNWIVGHTDRFKAAVSQRGIANWGSMSCISDIGYTFVPDQNGTDIWTDPEEVWRQSPLRYAPKVTTPTLLIHSDEDHRCEVSQAYQFFTALKLHGVETALCVFKGENHELSRTGRPRPRLTRLRKITDWFDRFLKGEDLPEK